jgi:hypothetical protein
MLSDQNAKRTANQALGNARTAWEEKMRTIFGGKTHDPDRVQTLPITFDKTYAEFSKASAPLVRGKWLKSWRYRNAPSIATSQDYARSISSPSSL